VAGGLRPAAEAHFVRQQVRGFEVWHGGPTRPGVPHEPRSSPRRELRLLSRKRWYLLLAVRYLVGIGLFVGNALYLGTRHPAFLVQLVLNAVVMAVAAGVFLIGPKSYGQYRRWIEGERAKGRETEGPNSGRGDPAA